MGLAVTKQEAFWEACGFGHKERVRKFITEGIDVNWVSYTHNSCAIHVASQGKKEIVQMLLDAGCNVHAVDDRGNLALHHAAMKGHADIVQMLIDAGSNVDTQDKNGWTPLIYASYFCQPDVVQVLLNNKCSITMQNKDTRTALHEVCRSPSDEEDGLSTIAKQLIAAGSDLNSKSSDVGDADFTPLMFCAYHGHPLVAEALIAAGCDINALGSNGWSALHWAADRDQMRLVQILLDSNIDAAIRGKRGELAVDRAQNRSVRDLLQPAAVDQSDDEISGSLQHVTSSDSASLSSLSQSACSSDQQPAVVQNTTAADVIDNEQEQQELQDNRLDSCTEPSVAENCDRAATTIQCHEGANENAHISNGTVCQQVTNDNSNCTEDNKQLTVE